MREAFRAAGAPSFEGRVARLDALGKALAARKDAFADAIARDFGHRARQETLLGDIFPVLSAIDYTKSHLRDWMEPSERETTWPFRPAQSQVVVQPLGVVGILSPWNYPLQLSLVPLVAAIAAGNRAMLKPSEFVPLTAELLRELVAATCTEDEVAVITGGPETGEAFASLPFDHLVFTGSTRVGKLVMRAASENLVPVTLELGGKSPVIVGGDFAASAAATRVMTGKAFNAGQSCIAPDYALVPAATRDAFVAGCKAAAAKLYPSIAKNPDYTSIVSDGHFARLRAHVDDARAHGATVQELLPAGESPEGLREARKIAPTLILDVTPEMTCMGEELFGPLLPVVTYTDLSEAIAYVNDRPRPLALYYFGHHEDDVARVIAETIAGGVGINETMLQILQDDLPFGGVGPSGMGQYHGRYGFDALSKAKPVFRQSRINATGLLRPPYRGLQNGLLRFLVGR
ncbi:MAG TPA: coniferyl aldehyde dehydrogenase [Polyangiaceae bacterium]|nr:coniferyl aldehyde dehydrogenase [Polyangiaceae bacterium]